MAIFTFDFAKVIFLAGPFEITGFMDGSDSISVEADADDFEKTIGLGGEVARSAINNETAGVIAKLMQTSPSNLPLLGFRTAKQVFPIVIKDGGSLETCATGEAWVKRRPKIIYGKGIQGREWTFDTGKMLMTPTGYAIAGVL